MGIFGRPDEPGLDYDVGVDEVGITLTTHTGPLLSNYTYEDRLFTSEVPAFGTTNTKLLNCKVVVGGNYGVRSLAKNGLPSAKNFQMERVTATGLPSTIIYGPAIQALRCRFTGAKDDIIKTHGATSDPTSWSHIYQCVLEDGGNVSTSHCDGDQFGPNSGFTHFQETVFNLPYPGSSGALAQGFSGKSNACIFASVGSGPIRNVTAYQCWFDGGNFTNYFQYHNTWNGSAVLEGCWITDSYFRENNAMHGQGRVKIRARILNTRLVTSTSEFYGFNWHWASDNVALEGVPTGSIPTPPSLLAQSELILPMVRPSGIISVPFTGDTSATSRLLLPRVRPSNVVRVFGQDVIRRRRFLPLKP